MAITDPLLIFREKLFLVNCAFKSFILGWVRAIELPKHFFWGIWSAITNNRHAELSSKRSVSNKILKDRVHIERNKALGISTTTTNRAIVENPNIDVEEQINFVTQNVMTLTANPGINNQPEPMTNKIVQQIPRTDVNLNNQAVTEYSQYAMKPRKSLSYEVLTENVAWKKHLNDDIKNNIQIHSSKPLPMEKLPPFIYIIVDSELYKIYTKTLNWRDIIITKDMRDMTEAFSLNQARLGILIPHSNTPVLSNTAQDTAKNSPFQEQIDSLAVQQSLQTIPNRTHRPWQSSTITPHLIFGWHNSQNLISSKYTTTLLNPLLRSSYHNFPTTERGKIGGFMQIQAKFPKIEPNPVQIEGN